MSCAGKARRHWKLWLGLAISQAELDAGLLLNSA